MDCLSPIFIVNPKYKEPGQPYRLRVPCGKCEACLRRYQSTWAIRLRFELDNLDYSCFVTLTYDDENLPEGFNVCKEDVQKFHKRLRESLPKSRRSFKYFLTSEYGPQTFRPHYHAIYFGLSAMDLPLFEKSWQKGFVTASEVTEGRVRYVTGYIIEKLFVPDGRKPLFNLISKGLGKCYVDSHKSWHTDLPMDDRAYIPYFGRKFPLPRYYKEKLYTEEQRKEYALKMSEKAKDEREQQIHSLGLVGYIRRTNSATEQYIKQVRKTHKKKKL